MADTVLTEFIRIVTNPKILVRAGDIIRLDVENRSLTFDVTDGELQARTRSLASGVAYAAPTRGWASLYVDHVIQADTGADLRLPGGHQRKGQP